MFAVSTRHLKNKVPFFMYMGSFNVLLCANLGNPEAKLKLDVGILKDALSLLGMKDCFMTLALSGDS